MIVTKLFLLLQVLGVTAARPGVCASNSGAGTHFSFYLPSQTRQNNDWTTASLHMMTEELRARVSLFTPNHATFSEASVELVQYEPKMSNILIEGVPSDTGIYRAFHVNASAAVRIVVVRTHLESVRSYRVLLPEASCFNTYYVSTGRDGPFLAVTSFQSEVKLNVHFPNAAEPFNEACPDNQTCTDDSDVTFSLNPYSAWYLSIRQLGLRFQNVLIQANRPVFVVAGNRPTQDDDDANGHPSLLVGPLSNVNPRETWGKTYVTAVTSQQTSVITGTTLTLLFNTAGAPFRFTLFDGVVETSGTIQDSESSSYFTYDDSEMPLVVNAAVPFGLNQLFTATTGSKRFEDLTYLVPVEQWVNGVALMNNVFENDAMYFVVITTAAKKNVLLSNNESTIGWKNGTIRYAGRRFNYGVIQLKAPSVNVFTTERSGRLTVYMVVAGAFGEPATRDVTPLGFYNGRIYDEVCGLNAPFPSDGIDNDCDGFVDEEVKNERDDDGDGAIDEDTIAIAGQGQWARWVRVCRAFCPNTNRVQKSMKIRSCQTKRFGQDCQGNDTHVEKLASTACEAGNATATIDFICRCLPGCKSCKRQDKTSSPVCSECKDGYFEEKFCLRRCPIGWSGRGCSEGPTRHYIKSSKPIVGRPPMKVKATVNGKTRRSNTECQHENVGKHFLFALAAAMVVVLGIVICYFLIRG